MLAAIDCGEFDALIVDDLTRLSRDPGQLDALMVRILAAGVETHVISKGLVAAPDLMHAAGLN